MPHAYCYCARSLISIFRIEFRFKFTVRSLTPNSIRWKTMQICSNKKLISCWMEFINYVLRMHFRRISRENIKFRWQWISLASMADHGLHTLLIQKPIKYANKNRSELKSCNCVIYSWYDLILARKYEATADVAGKEFALLRNQYSHACNRTYILICCVRAILFRSFLHCHCFQCIKPFRVYSSGRTSHMHSAIFITHFSPYIL